MWEVESIFTLKSITCEFRVSHKMCIIFHALEHWCLPLTLPWKCCYDLMWLLKIFFSCEVLLVRYPHWPLYWVTFKLHRVKLLCGELFPVLRWRRWHPVWSSAVTANLLQGSVWCAYRYIWVTVAFLSDQWSLSSDLWRQQCIFTQRTGTYWIFSLFWTILYEP